MSEAAAVTTRPLAAARIKEEAPETKLYDQVPREAGSGAAAARAAAPLVCKLPGCTSNLAAQREFNQRHRLCDEHQRALVLELPGGPKRFCQQCNRLHSIDSFDGDKRGCRVRLERHNRRRRVRKMVNKREKSTSGTTGLAGVDVATGATGVSGATNITGGRASRLRHSDPDETPEAPNKRSRNSGPSSGDEPYPGAGIPPHAGDPLASLSARNMIEQMHSAWGAAPGNLYGAGRSQGMDPRLASLVASSASPLPITGHYPPPGPEAPSRPWSGAFPPPMFPRGMGSAESAARYQQLVTNYQRDLASQAGYPMDRPSLQATLAVKIRDATPDALPPHLREQLLLWMRDDPESLMGYLRPGCAFLTTDFSLRKGSDPKDVTSRLARGITSAVLCADPFWSAWDMDVLLADRTLAIRDGVVVSHPRDNGMEICSVSHAATAGGQFFVACRGWDTSHSTLYARSNGHFYRLAVDPIPLQDSGVTLLATRMLSSMELGVAWLEVVTEKAGEITQASAATPVMLTTNSKVAHEVCSIAKAAKPAAGSLLAVLEDVFTLLHRREHCALDTCDSLARLGSAFGSANLHKAAAAARTEHLRASSVWRAPARVPCNIMPSAARPCATKFASWDPYYHSGMYQKMGGFAPVWT